MIVGYARESTDGHTLDAQQIAPREAGANDLKLDATTPSPRLRPSGVR
jgi:hypothetical protein